MYARAEGHLPYLPVYCDTVWTFCISLTRPRVARAQSRGCLPMVSSPFDAALPQFAAVAANLSVLSHGCRPPQRASGAHAGSLPGSAQLCLLTLENKWRKGSAPREPHSALKQKCLHDNQ